MNISFIGYGNMAKAIARGLIHQGPHSLAAAAPSLSPGINKDQIQTHYDNKVIVKDANVIILAVKPITMKSILQEITPYLPPHCLLISVAAGLNLPWFAKHCKTNQALIRTMPNTPSSVGLGAIPMLANKYCNDENKQQAETIFSKIGITTWAKTDEEMDALTALSGSGPAYVYSFLEALVNAGVELGLTESIAKSFAIQTVQGALKLAQNENLSLTELTTRVTSPGGTTEAALNILHTQLKDLVLASMRAAKERAHQLSTMQ